MKKLNREKTIRAINEAFAGQDQELLRRMCRDEEICKVIGQASVFKIWHGFDKLDDLSDDALICLIGFLNFDDTSALFEFTDYSYLYQEYLGTIQNDSTRYQTQQGLLRVVEGASTLFRKDLPEVNREEAMDIAEAMLKDTSPTTIYRSLRCASVFCKWCIDNQKYPGAQDNFKKLPKVSIESWVKGKLVKNDVTLSERIKSAIPLNEGYAEPVLLALAWMGFSREEVLTLKNEEVNLVDRTVRDVVIPDAFLGIFLQYDGGSRAAPCGKNSLEWYQEDLGYYLKRIVCAPFGTPFDKALLARSITMTKYTFDNVTLSRRLYDIYQKEVQTKEQPSISDIASGLGVSEAAVKNRYLEIYNVYKSLFWENA